MLTISSFVKSTQKSHLKINKNKDILSKYYIGKRESHPYEYNLSKSLKVSDIKQPNIKSTSINASYMYLHV